MFNLYDLMKAGYSAEDLAQEFADSMNVAEARLKEEAEAEAERQAKLAAESEETKRIAAENDIIEILFLFWNVLNKHYPEKCGDALSEEDARAIATIVMSLLDPKSIKSVNPFAEMMKVKWMF